MLIVDPDRYPTICNFSSQLKIARSEARKIYRYLSLNRIDIESKASKAEIPRGVVYSLPRQCLPDDCNIGLSIRDRIFKLYTVPVLYNYFATST